MAWLASTALIALSAAASPLGFFVLPGAVFGPMELHWFFIAAVISTAIVHLPLAWAYCRFVLLVARDD